MKAVIPRKVRGNTWFNKTTGELMFSLGVDQLPVTMRGPQGLLCFFTSYLWGSAWGVSRSPLPYQFDPKTPVQSLIYIHVVYEKHEKPCGPFMATRSPPAPGLVAIMTICFDKTVTMDTLKVCLWEMGLIKVPLNWVVVLQNDALHKERVELP